jgi:hypothetical protein
MQKISDYLRAGVRVFIFWIYWNWFIYSI